MKIDPKTIKPGPATDEGDMRQKIIQILRPFDAISVENGVGVGTPDVNSVLGWIECKCAAMPVRHDTKVTADHFTQEQKIWLLKRWRAGGSASLLLKVADWWLLFTPQTAFEIVGKVPFHKLVDECYNGWHGVPDRTSFIETLIDLCSRKTLVGGKDCTSDAGETK